MYSFIPEGARRARLRQRGAPHPFPHTPGVPGGSTQRWEHRTAVLIFSSKAVRFVWYSTSAWEASFFLTEQSRGEDGQRAGGTGNRGLGACPLSRAGPPRAGSLS